MAKNNNKGFSLVEIIFAIAILSILLTPIIRQFSNTLETSRKAKALQEANETAVYEVEAFQSYSKDELEAEFGAPVTKADLPVTLYAMDGSVIDTISYNAYVYSLPDTEVGAKKDKYSNVVILDDLSNKVRAYGGETASTHYKVAYNLTDTQLAAVGGDDFDLTNEGTIVEYDDDGFIKGIVCTDTNADGSAVSYVENPNEVNLGNMHDLDKNSVALIMGGTSSYDSQAFTSLFSKAMEHLRELDYDSWQQALVNVDNESILSQDTITSSSRLIKIYTDKQADATTGKDCYIVKADVYYDYSYTLTSMEGATGTYHDMITYTVFSQKFFTEDAPEIYFEYQPYCISGTAGADVVYNDDDYILFDNNVDECKLYLYKPFRDQQNADATEYDYYVDSTTDGETQILGHQRSEYYTYYTTAAHDKKVKIHLASKNSNTTVRVNEDLEPVDDNQLKRIYIFTNLDVTGFGADLTADSQFVSDAFEDKFRYVKGEKETAQNVDRLTDAVYTKYPIGASYQEERPNGDGTSMLYGMKVLYTLSEDTRESERLYTITVRMTPEKDGLNEVRLSGAKGAN